MRQREEARVYQSEPEKEPERARKSVKELGLGYKYLALSSSCTTMRGKLAHKP